MDESIRIPVIIEGDKAFIALSDIAKSARNTGVAVKSIGDPMRASGNAAFAFNQILRETPAFAFNFQTGIMAISNNLPVFTDALKRAREAGSSNMQILKGLGSSLVSLPSILSIASLGIMMFGDSMFSASSGMGQMAKAASEAKESFTTAFKVVENLRQGIELAKNGMKSKSEVVKEYNETLGKTTGAVKSLEEAERAIIKNGEAYIAMTLQKSIANVALGKAAELAFDIELNTIRLQTEKQKLIGMAAAAQEMAIQKVIDKNERLKKQSEEYIAIAKTAMASAGNIARSMNFDLEGNINTDKVKIKAKKLELSMPDLKGQSLDLGPGVVIRIQEGMMGVEAPKTFNEILAKKIQDDIGKLVVKPNIRIAFNKDAFNLAQEQAKLIEQLNNSLKQIMGDAVMSIAEGIGSAIGTGEISNAFKTIASAIGQGFIAIGKQMVAASPVIAALKSAIKTLNPAVLLPAGLSLIAIGAALRSTMNNSVKLASGGLLFNRTLAEVGEGIGTTRQNPEVVTPLDKLKGFFADMITGRTFGKAANSAYGGSNVNIPDVVYLYADGDSLRGTLSLNGLKQGRLR